MFLAFGAWEAGGTIFEIASRKNLDSRVVVPFFHDARGELQVGLLHRERASRGVRGEGLAGVEPIGFDFKGVDETADLLGYSHAMFGGRTALRLAGRQFTLPSYARSIGYLTELTLPLLAEVEPPEAPELPVEWDGERHAIVFQPARELLGHMPRGTEDLWMLLRALVPAEPRRFEGRARVAAPWKAEQLRSLRSDTTYRRIEGYAPRFLRLGQIGRWEVITPATGRSLAVLPYVVQDGEPYFLLWHELRPAALERRERAPLFDLPLALQHVNATARWVRGSESIAEVLGFDAAIVSVEELGEGEPSPGTSSEVRRRVACQLAQMPALAPDMLAISAAELCRAIGDGLVRDPVIVAGVQQLGFDPFAEARRGMGEGFLRAMTQGSIVQRRLQSYSSIEKEQLRSRTYARLMTLLQHEYGVRIAYPKTEKDREFFKAAYRVFMAADRGDDRALQGLHWSHDAYHFGLKNFAAPPLEGFDEWYVSGGPPPEAKPEGPAWETYSRALKAAENEATFFSFWTLYDEHEPLKRHVGKLTFWEALRDLGITARAEAREVYDAVVDRAELPGRIAQHPIYQARADIQSLFKYMLGFRAYHFKDIAIAWGFAVKEPYRGLAARFGIYETDLTRYLEHVRTFQQRLSEMPPGFHPLKAAWAEVKVDLHLRVWDVIKALKLLRKAHADAEKRRGFLRLAEGFFAELQTVQERLYALLLDDAEMTPRNERLHATIRSHAAAVEELRQRLWDAVELQGVDVSAERTRELPR